MFVTMNHLVCLALSLVHFIAMTCHLSYRNGFDVALKPLQHSFFLLFNLNYINCSISIVSHALKQPSYYLSYLFVCSPLIFCSLSGHWLALRSA